MLPSLAPIPDTLAATDTNTNTYTRYAVMNSVHMQAIISLADCVNIRKSCSYDNNESVTELQLCETSAAITIKCSQSELNCCETTPCCTFTEVITLVWCLLHSTFQVPLTGLSKKSANTTTRQCSCEPCCAKCNSTAYGQQNYHVTDALIPKSDFAHFSRHTHLTHSHRAHLRGMHFLGSFATQPSPSTSSDNPSKPICLTVINCV